MISALQPAAEFTSRREFPPARVEKEPVENPVILSDTALIQEALNGNSNAFGDLVKKYHPKFIGMAIRHLGNPVEAEDVLQEAFIQAFRHLPNFQHRSRFSTWLYSIVLNRIRNQIRHNRVLHFIPLDTGCEPDEHRELAVPEKNPALDVALEHKFQVEAIHEAIKYIPAHYRTVFVLHYFKGLSLEAISNQLDRPVGTMKAYLHRSRKMLLARLNS